MKHLAFLGIILLFAASASGAVVYFHTDSYRARTDSPFLPFLQGGLTYVENFENQGSQRPRSLLTTPYVTGWNGISFGNPGWGVQEDYTNNDPLGYRWANNGSSPDATKLPAGIHFDFTPDEHDRLPEYVGAALRGSTVLGTDPAFNIILVYDRNGAEVTDLTWKIPKPVIDPNTPIESLFLNFEGVYVSGGISRIHFRDFREVDHLTYGYSAIPEPASAGLAVAAALAFGLRRKRLV
jgi:hypothetical protein